MSNSDTITTPPTRIRAKRHVNLAARYICARCAHRCGMACKLYAKAHTIKMMRASSIYHQSTARRHRKTIKNTCASFMTICVPDDNDDDGDHACAYTNDMSNLCLYSNRPRIINLWRSIRCKWSSLGGQPKIYLQQNVFFKYRACQVTVAHLPRRRKRWIGI